MSIKVEFEDSKPTGSYPRLMTTSSGTVVLMECDESGTVIYAPDTGWCAGEHSDQWDMDDFTDFHGSITLSNE